MLRECLVKHVNFDCTNEPRNGHGQNSEMRANSQHHWASLMYDTSCLTEIYDLTQPNPGKSTASTILQLPTLYLWRCIMDLIWIWAFKTSQPLCLSQQSAAVSWAICLCKQSHPGGWDSLVPIQVTCHSVCVLFRCYSGGGSQSVISACRLIIIAVWIAICFDERFAWIFILSCIGDVIEIMAVWDV